MGYLAASHKCQAHSSLRAFALEVGLGLSALTYGSLLPPSVLEEELQPLTLMICNPSTVLFVS